MDGQLKSVKSLTLNPITNLKTKSMRGIMTMTYDNHIPWSSHIQTTRAPSLLIFFIVEECHAFDEGKLMLRI